MGLWSSPKPTIAQVHGWCVGGGSDMALSADLVIAAEDAQIGTPNSRMWGCYLSILDGAMRNTPEALVFIDTAMTEGVPAAVALRDGPFGDYSQRKS